MQVTSRLGQPIWVGLLLVSLLPIWPALAGPAAEEPALPSRPERHAPMARPESRLPQPPEQPHPPPPESMPGPLSRDQQRLFDGLRSEGIDLYHEGRYGEAADRFRQALRLKPNDTVTQRWLKAAESHPH